MRHVRPAMAAAIAAAAFMASPIASGGALAQQAVSQQIAPQAAQTAPSADQVKSVLSQYGSFVQHPKYGEVWVPTVTPQGWHPYPACQWVNSKYGWYLDDRTPWGQIVHHYGRWAHDGQMGWIWIAGAEFSPGWVVWRTSEQWIGWAPMTPDQDLKTVSVDQFNNSDEWTFMDVAKFSTGCTPGGVVAAQQISLVLKQTKYVTQIDYVGGIAIFVLPPYVIGPIVDINVAFNPWPLWVFGQLVGNWNWIWQNTLIWNVNIVCAP